MLTFQENETLARVGPGTSMGAVMRRYWMPTLLSWELPEPDCPPIRVRLLGEDLVAFRDTSGDVGILDNYCPHRRASLFFGRNEECGLRCVYHGWKFDVNGDCVDMPSEPAESNFKDKVKITAYPTAEFGGMVWTYMGPRDLQPPPPTMEWTQVPDLHRGTTKVVQRCNWLQGLEGGIDSVHTNFLHRRFAGSGTDVMDRARANSLAAHVEVVPTDYGYTYAGIRHVSDDEGDYVRAYHFIAPFYQLRPGGQLQRRHGRASGHIWVPIDDENTMVWNFSYRFDGNEMAESERKQTGSGNEFGVDIDVEKGFRSRAAAENDYLIDREVQRTQTFSGIPGHQHAGPCRAGHHGPHLRPHPRAPWHHGPRHHHGAQDPAERRPRCGGRRRPARAWSKRLPTPTDREGAADGHALAQCPLVGALRRRALQPGLRGCVVLPRTETQRGRPVSGTPFRLFRRMRALAAPCPVRDNRR